MNTKAKESKEQSKKMTLEESRYINPCLHNLALLLERPKALQERVFQKVFEQAEIARYTPEERREYVTSVKNYWDYNSTLETAIKKAKLEDALRMKADNMPTKLIAKYTDLSIDEIERL